MIVRKNMLNNFIVFYVVLMIVFKSTLRLENMTNDGTFKKIVSYKDQP